MVKLSSYRDLIAWQKAIHLANVIYDVTDQFPKHELYGLAAQLRRAVVSISSNLAEGSVRGNKEFAHFITIARGSLAEIETQIIIAHHRKYLSTAELENVTQFTEELSRILMGLLKSIKSSN